MEIIIPIITAQDYEQAHNELNMPNKDLTELVFVIDRSGSMDVIWNDTIGGLNSTLNTNRQNKDSKVRVTIVAFDNEFTKPYDNVPLESIKDISPQAFPPRGSTALNYAICRTIDEVGKRLAATHDSDRPGLVHVMILTDGFENHSQFMEPRYNRYDVKSRIEHQRDSYAWKFDFIGANQNAYLTAQEFGIGQGSTLTMAANARGTKSAFESLTTKSISYRSANSAGLAATACMDFSNADYDNQKMSGVNQDGTAVDPNKKA
jgi:uncharacterized protein YegL